MTQKLNFPAGFLWGAATSAYQIEGAWNEAGRGESVWDRYSHTPRKIKNGDTGDVACDHYHRWREDVALMKELGLKAYRFSTAWPRILPTGRGAVNPQGLDFYARLVDTLLENDIQPFITLDHWDVPQALQEPVPLTGGGWPARSTAEAFVEYADVVTRHLGDRVRHWITINEPWCESLLSYQIGSHAPGLEDWRLALPAAHHLLLAHGWAMPIIRRNSPQSEVGIVLNQVPAEPASSSTEDYWAFREFDGYFNRWFLDPLFGRHYPADTVAEYIDRGHLPPEGLVFVQPGDLESIAAPMDFLGLNYYNRSVLRSAEIPESQNQPRTVFTAPRSEWTEMPWEVYPEGLYRLLTQVHLVYQPRKIYITENGASYSDGPGEDGKIHDTRRITYLRGHFAAAQRAIQNGVPLAGYFVWSLMDNFEWTHGFSQRFGLVWVDFATQQRIPKDSAYWYRQVIAANGLF